MMQSLGTESANCAGEVATNAPLASMHFYLFIFGFESTQLARRVQPERAQVEVQK